MKQYTHAWLAFIAVKRLNDVAPKLTDKNKTVANDLVRFIMHHEDDIIQGAWYPDAVIKDMANSHVLKMTPSTQATNQFKTLPTTHLFYNYTKDSQLKKNRSISKKKTTCLTDVNP